MLNVYRVLGIVTGTRDTVENKETVSLRIAGIYSLSGKRDAEQALITEWLMS